MLDSRIIYSVRFLVLGGVPVLCWLGLAMSTCLGISCMSACTLLFCAMLVLAELPAASLGVGGLSCVLSC